MGWKTGLQILTQDRHFGEEVLIHFSLADGRSHEDASIGVPVDAPKLHICLGLHCCSSRSSINESQLSKASSFSNSGHQLPIFVDLP